MPVIIESYKTPPTKVILRPQNGTIYVGIKYKIGGNINPLDYTKVKEGEKIEIIKPVQIKLKNKGAGTVDVSVKKQAKTLDIYLS